ncbi:tetratricopeptide repeat protein [Catellatospora tritici]|uniref:tetratricopeptide repeat protein n=1 Tax=Catellatospora tritici TaxID=2851566 RepID=UPI001C2D327B|nr:tetratricopeptide repeat protein [Catellatospora tritici]MBV1853517.1 tetratricopeptide repeat protein [Catellatospora tritici]
MADYTKRWWPAEGPVLELLSYLDKLHASAGRPTMVAIARAVHLEPATVHQFFTGKRLVGQVHLRNLALHLDGDTELAEQLRRAAVPAWQDLRAGRPAAEPAPPSAHREPVAGQPTGGWTAAPDSTEGSEVIFYEAAVNRPNRPRLLVGRADLIDAVGGRLDTGARLLLHGLGGSGKTALAATIADRRIEAGKGPYLWVRVGTTGADVVLDAMARCLATVTGHRWTGTSGGDGRLLAVAGAITASGATLCVFDDAWDAGTLHTVLQAVPDHVGVLVTSRFRIGAADQVLVDGLDPVAAAGLLAHHAQQDSYTARPDSYELCAYLAYQPYLIEIAGHRLRQYALTPAELRRQLDTPTEIEMPAGFAAPGRENGQRLLDTTYEALSPDARAVLGAVGGLFSGVVTPGLVERCLGYSANRTLAALNALVDASFAKRAAGTTAYAFHDLTIGYARVLGAPRDPGAAITAVRAFVEANRADHHVIALDLDNVIAAAERAQSVAVEDFLAIVTTLAEGGYLDTYGHLALLNLVDAAIARLWERHDVPRLHLLLSKRGNACYNQREFAQAVQCYQQALALAPTAARRAVLLSVIGKSYAESGQRAESDEAFEQAYAMAAAEDDEAARVRVLEAHTVAAFRQRDYDRVRELAEQGVALSRESGNRASEAYFLNNLGTAHFHLGVEASLSYHRMAMDIGTELDNQRVLALTHYSVGIDHHALEDFDEARAHLAEARRLHERLGETGASADLRAVMLRFGYLN